MPVRDDVLPRQGRGVPRSGSRAEAGWPVLVQRLGFAPAHPFGRITHELIGSFFASNPPQFYAVPFSCHAIDPLKQSLSAAGFTDIAISIVRRDQPVRDFTAFARGVIFGNPVLDQIIQRKGPTPETVQRAVVDAFRKELGPEPATMPLQAILFEARRP